MPSSGPTGYKTKLPSVPRSTQDGPHDFSLVLGHVLIAYGRGGEQGERGQQEEHGTAKHLTLEVPPSLLSTLAGDSGFVRGLWPELCISVRIPYTSPGFQTHLGQVAVLCRIIKGFLGHGSHANSPGRLGSHGAHPRDPEE